jgi:hypothetical protein
MSPNVTGDMVDIVIVKMSNSQNIIFHICMDSKYKRRKKEKYKC